MADSPLGSLVGTVRGSVPGVRPRQTMTLQVPTTSYALAPGADPGALLATLAEQLGRTVEPVRPPGGATRPRIEVVLDTADRLLRAAGLDLVATAAGPSEAAPVAGAPGATGASPVAGASGAPGIGPGAGAVALVLRGPPGEPAVRATLPPAPRYLLDDLPEGRLRDRLASLVGIRALLPIVRVRRTEWPAAVRDDEGKVVVRLSISELAALPAPPATLLPAAVEPDAAPTSAASVSPSPGSPASPEHAPQPGPGARPAPAPGPAADEPVPLRTRVQVTGVLGYPKPFARVRRALAAPPLALARATETVADEAVVALGGIPQGVAVKVDVGLRPDDRTDVAAVRILRALAHVVESNLPGTVADLDTEFLHDLRVAVRKSRSVLREMKGALDPGARRAQAESLRWLQGLTGPTRDLDVQLLEWDEVVSHVPADRRADLAPVRELLVAHRTEAFRELAATLQGDEHRRRWTSWRAFLAGDPEASDSSGGAGDGPDREQPPDAARPVREVAGRRVRAVYERMVRMGGAIDDGSPAGALHDLRKRGKELRYLLELFGGVLSPRSVRPMVAALKGLQGVLGMHQDREVQADRLRALAPEVTTLPRGGAQALLAMGSLIDRLEEEQAQARRRFAERFAAFTGLEVPR